MYVLYLNDTETTGMEKKHDIIELSMNRILIKNGKASTEQRTWHLKPLNPKEIEDEALAVNGYKREDLLHQTEYGRNTFLDPNIIIPQIELWVEEDGVSIYDRVFIGHNAPFDASRMQWLWEKTGNSSTFPFELSNDNRILDTKTIMLLIDICTGKRRKYYNLSSGVEAFGAKKEKAHKAENDVRMNTDFFLKMLLPIMDFVGEKFKDCYE